MGWTDVPPSSAKATAPEEAPPKLEKVSAPVDRERLQNDMVNTGVMAALIGGFALGNLQVPKEGDKHEGITTGIYLMACFAVHMCTCSALSSAFIYRIVNKLDDDSVEAWAKKFKLLLPVPLMKFVMGTVCYMMSVVLISYRDLENTPATKWIAFIFGIMGIIMVFGTFFILEKVKVK
mmetsp:Transcript_3614/g.6379  ORF Transcript_3614/g.6379 Transcript_3614/m.6379 type:complete len:178 (-) Transcript_3614:42-575(-)